MRALATRIAGQVGLLSASVLAVRHAAVSPESGRGIVVAVAGLSVLWLILPLLQGVRDSVKAMRSDANFEAVLVTVHSQNIANLRYVERTSPLRYLLVVVARRIGGYMATILAFSFLLHAQMEPLHVPGLMLRSAGWAFAAAVAVAVIKLLYNRERLRRMPTSVEELDRH